MDKTNYEMDAIILIKILNKEINRDFSTRLEEYDLTSEQGRILFFIICKTVHEKEDIHQNDIEAKFKLSKSTVSGFVKRLEAKGLIKREIKKPYVTLYPTEKAMEVVDNINFRRKETLEKLLKGYSEEERKSLIEGLLKLINNIREGN